MAQDDWDDLRFVLAVTEGGTVSRAARRLGVNHAAVLRRIARFEARCGPVFDKTPRSYASARGQAGLIAAAPGRTGSEAAARFVEPQGLGPEAQPFDADERQAEGQHDGPDQNPAQGRRIARPLRHAQEHPFNGHRRGPFASGG